MKKLIIIPFLFLVACNEEENGTVIPNKKFQDKCIERGGTITPTRYGYGGCVIDGYSVSKIDGVGFHE